MSRRYFEEEMRYLQEAGREFAAAHPEQARYLNLDSAADRDPYVERLFEGFAFLTGRIRQQLDDEMEVYTRGLLDQLWPQVLRPIPSLSILEFTPRPGLVQRTTVLPAGTEVRSAPVGDEATVCRFTTTQAVRLQPLALNDVDVEQWTEEGTSRVDLHFRSLGGGIDYGRLELSPLRLFFQADLSTASTMYLFFTRHVRRVSIWAGPNRETVFYQAELGDQECIVPTGLAEEESLIPQAPHEVAGFRLLQEYLNFRPKFWFVDLLGLERLDLSQVTGEFHVEVEFDRPFPEEKLFGAQNVRLFCTPIVNLFRSDADPIVVDHLDTEYRIQPRASRPQSMETYRVEKVTGVEEATGRRYEYVPFYSFRHGGSEGERFFNSSVRAGPTGHLEGFISIGGFDSQREPLRRETLSLELTCSNGNLPYEQLREGTITEVEPGFANLATFTNLTRPTQALPPPRDQQRDLFWQLISHLSLNHMSIAERGALSGLLGLYDWGGNEANRLRIAALHSVSWEPKEVIHRGGIVRGAEVTIELLEENFTDAGDICLFGLVLNHLFSAYTTINSFVHLTIATIPSGRRYTWQPDAGTKSLL